MKTLITALFAIFVTISVTQAQGLYDGKLVTPLPYFDDFDKGYMILRDGTKLQGDISIKKYESDGRIDIQDKSGEKYKLQVESVKEWGLDINVPVSYSPMSWYDWKNNKRKENKEPERGFIKLTSGELLEGKIEIHGNSTESSLAGRKFFALEEIDFVGKDGSEKTYPRAKIAGYGRITPWELAPRHMFMAKSVFAFGKQKSQKVDGFALLNDGSRLDGPMQLVVINSMNTADAIIYSDMVDEVYFERDGKDDKVDLDDIFAYGINGMTIQDITKNGDIKFGVDEMNFHPGYAEKKDGTKVEGLVAFFPEPGNYYGVYVAKTTKDPVEIIALDDLVDVRQEISTIEAFDGGFGYGAAPDKNTNINGFIVQESGKKLKGTVSVIDDMGWYAKSIGFVNEDNEETTYGVGQLPIFYAMIGDDAYVQHRDVFVKVEGLSSPMDLYYNPYVDKSNSVGNRLLMLTVESMAASVGEGLANEINTAQFKSAMKNNRDLSDVNFSAGYNIGSTVSEGIVNQANKVIFGGQKPKKESKGDKYNIVNLKTGEIAIGSKANWETLLEGCHDYLKLDSKKQKAILSSPDEDLIKYINERYY